MPGRMAYGEGQGSLFLSLFSGLLLFLLVLFLAWYCTRWIGKRYGTQGKCGRIEILERVPLGPNSFLIVIRLGEKVSLLGGTAQHINYLGDVDPNLYPDSNSRMGGCREANNLDAHSFTEELRQRMARFSQETIKKDKHDE